MESWSDLPASTATAPTLGQGKWGAGASIVLLTQPKHWTIGLLSNNIWSFAGNQGRPRVNQFLTQYFATRNFEHGWFLTSSPILTANWRAPAGNQWLVPFGGGFGKITRFFDQAMVWQIPTDEDLMVARYTHGMAFAKG